MTSNSNPRFTLRQRITLWATTWAAPLLIRLIGPTLRLRVSVAEGELPDPALNLSIYCMWHRGVLAAAYAYRNKKLRIMISRSFDGEMIARVAEKLGYVPVRGSSSRGGAKALLELHEEIKNGASAVFTVDGPRGPRYVVKPGAVLLARNTGVPVVAFHIALERAWVLRSWDALMIPKPFSRGVLRVEAPFTVPAEAEDVAPYVGELQSRMDNAREAAEQVLASRELGRLPLLHTSRTK